MQSITWMAPVLPGQLDNWKKFTADLKGPRRKELEESRRRLGIHREVASLTHTPQGMDFVCLYHQADDLGKAFRLIAESDQPFDVWFRKNLQQIHGLTAEQLTGPIPARLFLDFDLAA